MFFSESASVGERCERILFEDHFRVRCEAKDKHCRVSRVKTSRVAVFFCTAIWVEPWSYASSQMPLAFRMKFFIYRRKTVECDKALFNRHIKFDYNERKDIYGKNQTS